MNILTERWYAQPDDLIGGWCVMNRDYPPSQLNRDADPDAREVGNYLSEEIARHVVELHNASLEPTGSAVLAEMAAPICGVDGTPMVRTDDLPSAARPQGRRWRCPQAGCLGSHWEPQGVACG